LAGALAALSLAACVATPDPAYRGRMGYQNPSDDSTLAAPATQEASLTAPTQPTGPTRGITLETLPGMTGDAVAAALGAPQFRRHDGIAEIWQYRGTACTLDVFLYADGGSLRVRYADARSKNEVEAKNSAEARACAAALIAARAPTS
jgi:hypothetical protein